MTTDDRFAGTIDERLPAEPQGIPNEIVEGPVSDYATDFDHTATEWVADPFPIMDDLRERCPVAHTDRYGGGWLPTRRTRRRCPSRSTEMVTFASRCATTAPASR